MGYIYSGSIWYVDNLKEKLNDKRCGLNLGTKLKEHVSFLLLGYWLLQI